MIFSQGGGSTLCGGSHDAAGVADTGTHYVSRRNDSAHARAARFIL